MDQIGLVLNQFVIPTDWTGVAAQIAAIVVAALIGALIPFRQTLRIQKEKKVISLRQKVSVIQYLLAEVKIKKFEISLHRDYLMKIEMDVNPMTTSLPIPSALFSDDDLIRLLKSGETMLGMMKPHKLSPIAEIAAGYIHEIDAHIFPHWSSIVMKSTVPSDFTLRLGQKFNEIASEPYPFSFRLNLAMERLSAVRDRQSHYQLVLDEMDHLIDLLNKSGDFYANAHNSISEKSEMIILHDDK